METIVRDLMTSPAVTCAADDSLAVAARTMQEADTGSVVVTDDGKVVGILTERDLLRATAGAGGPDARTGPAVDDLAARRARARRAGRRGLGQPDLAPLPAPAGGRRGPLRRCRLVARPHGRGPHPPRHRDQRGRAGGPGGRGGGRDHHRRRARAGGLLPLPAVLGRRPGGDSLVGGRVAPVVPWRTPRRADLGCLRRGGAPPALPAAGPDHTAARDLPPGRTARRAPNRGLAARRRARLAPDARHRRGRARRPGGRPVRGRSDDPRRGVPAAPGSRARGAERRPGVRRQLPEHVDG